MANAGEFFVCMLMYIPRHGKFIQVEKSRLNNNGNIIPVFDERPASNILSTSVSGTKGKIRGRAYGVTNLIQNKRSFIGANFTYSFFLEEGSVFSNAPHRCTIDISAVGRFEHFAAKPFPDDPRTPTPSTISSITSRITIYQQNSSGNFSSLITSPQNILHNNSVTANNTEIDIIDTTETYTVEFTPPSDRAISIKVIITISAAATGSHSDIKVGSLVSFAKSFVVSASKARVQKIMPQNDFCRNVIGV